MTLTWANGQGLLFRRIISVDDNALFSIRDEVDNKGTTPVSLYPYGQVVRVGKPTTLGYYVLHEGMIGALGEQGLQEYTYDAIDKEPALGAATHGKAWKDAVGGFVGITEVTIIEAGQQMMDSEAVSRATAAIEELKQAA